MESIAYIYGLRDRSSPNYFYVGSTKHSLAHRWKQHQEQIKSGRNKNRHFTRTVAAIGVSNVVCELLETTIRSQRFERETYWIRLHGLTNIRKNPSAIQLDSQPKTSTDVEIALTKLSALRPSRLTIAAIEYGREVLTSLRVIEAELSTREVQI